LPAFAQKGETYNEDVPSLYGIHAELGYGAPGLGAGLGFRYEFFSFTVGLSGFANSIPNYLSYKEGENLQLNQPLPGGYVQEEYEAIVVSFDAAYNHEFDWGNVYAGVGFYSQQDTVLAKEVKTGDYYTRGVINSSGICFNFGADYYWSENIGIGLAIHTKKGILARFSYYWW
jgi:hypothetical protein